LLFPEVDAQDPSKTKCRTEAGKHRSSSSGESLTQPGCSMKQIRGRDKHDRYAGLADRVLAGQILSPSLNKEWLQYCRWFDNLHLPTSYDELSVMISSPLPSCPSVCHGGA
jgi:hypothetical protein